ncbi:haloacid dehalogenase [Meridianimarinicoccus roseus]|jgi:2-haloacid dehalogenase|uniref:Haloacid dehalogenase n=1 Tax=Meridianimarinicoccus roseus TaxID=2072018 RepID=A0A2V2LEC9_9RHOB|nr:HAD family phosphatase [Meridianimarinicoccus roseus]PWR02211.1 haloacid dehalogenase [Meridianimarinicoccus roseus]
MTVRAVVFDIGNVLIRWDPARFYDARIGPEARAALFARVDLDGMNLSVDAGADLHDAVEALAAANPGDAALIRMWRDNWLDFVVGPIRGSVALLRRLRAAGIPVHALTNFGHAPLALADAAYPFLREFDRRFVSAELRLCKPDPAIYAAVEAVVDAPPEGLFFIDDKPENIAAAAARGWQTHLFTEPEPLVSALAAAGVTAAQP